MRSGTGPRTLALVVALSVGTYLADAAIRSQAVLDADEAVHAVEALRLFDALRHEGPAAFAEKLYFPERWHPPVQDHLHWYAPAHSLVALPFYALLGPSDAAARLPSVVMLLAAAWVAWALARSLAPQRGELAGCLAVLLLLSSPNCLTFGAQALIETTALFACLLALFLWTRSAQRSHPFGRGLAAGAGLGLAFLSKYDHGLLLIGCLGLADLGRARFHVPRFLRSGAALVYVWPALIGAAWLAHPDKWTAFLDAAGHPFYGSVRLIAINMVATWLFEAGASPLVAVAALAAWWMAARDRDAARRGLWLWAGLSLVLLGCRARFLFRYHFVELPAFLVLLAAWLPEMLARAGERLERWPRGACVRRGFALAAAGALVLFLLAYPAPLHAFVRAAFGAVYGASETHWGLSLPPEQYLRAFRLGIERTRAFLPIELGGAALALAFFGAALVAGPRLSAARAVAVAFGLAFVTGVVGLGRTLPRRIAWEFESTGELRDIVSTVDVHTPPRARILLGGGWDQLANNSLRWHLIAARQPTPRYGDLDVGGDMIGSLVLPEEPRIAWWTNRLATAPPEDLPERIALIDMGHAFRYRTVRGPEVDLYRDVLARRGGYRLAIRRELEELGCAVEVWARSSDAPPLADWRELSPADIGPGTPVGERGWSVKDDSWRQLRNPWLFGAAPRPAAAAGG